MLKAELKELSTDKKTLRNFGLVVGGVFALLTAWFVFRGKPYFHLTLWPAAFLMFFGLVFPASLRLLYIGWMALALCLGLVMSTIILTAVFFFILTPIGILAKISGKDFMGRKPASSYWLLRTETWTPASLEKQF